MINSARYDESLNPFDDDEDDDDDFGDKSEDSKESEGQAVTKPGIQEHPVKIPRSKVKITM